MDIYNKPKSDVETNTTGDFRPVLGLFLGSLISIVLVLFLSTVISVVYLVYSGADLTDQNAMSYVLATSKTFLIADLIITSAAMLLAGRILRYFTPGREFVFAAVLALLTLAVYLGLTLLTAENYESYPLWYNTLSFASILFIFLGARPAKN